MLTRSEAQALRGAIEPELANDRDVIGTALSISGSTWRVQILLSSDVPSLLVTSLVAERAEDIVVVHVGEPSLD